MARRPADGANDTKIGQIMTCHERELGNSARRYIEQCLAEGHTLARNLLAALDLGTGRVTTWLPLTVSDEAAHQFDQGGKLPPSNDPARTCAAKDGKVLRMTPTPNTDTYLVRAIQTHLCEGSQYCAIFEHPYARPSDPFLVDHEPPCSIFQDEVYYCLARPDSEEAKIQVTIRAAIPRALIGVLTVQPSTVKACASRSLTANELKTWAKRTTRIVVGAYDGEGYVSWVLR